MNINSLLEKTSKTFFKPGNVYYQVINGEKYYFKPIKQSKNGKWKGKLLDPHKPNKIVNKSASDSSTNFHDWNEASNEEVPEILTEE